MQTKYFRYSADRLPVFLFLALSVLDFLLYFIVDNWLVLIPYILLVLPVKGAVSAFTHHHQHHKTFRSPVLNHILEFFYFLHTGATSNMWVLQHNLGHHINYKEPLKDEARWMTNNGQTMSALKYTVFNTLTIYGHVFHIGKRHPKLLKSVVYHHVIGLLLLATLLYYQPINALLLFLVPMLLIFIFTVFATYDHHAELDTGTPLHASRNNLNKLHNIMHGNLGYHTAHHLRPGLHWSKLPEFHETIKDQIPDELIHDSYFDWRQS
ncbi:fatty acid desaturase [Leucothrix arctica]|nr:fatty acid desaturase [Leucothrix arctica]